ncbi:MarR family winged helix-turn-helix transcriptional regulator [Cohnella nanjingensis]|uniref:MarR family transcriptional regulator n=1 Tax=Cohnella nanjingensis TaxID=1387779 RepID=A0A7X0RNK9_9BACL|nr:MarR family transcriptional regulator [Cohnella nanjingensis]MBB6669540.1 MarR family transcriptional regulator [Cohnella nanjingensis]
MKPDNADTAHVLMGQFSQLAKLDWHKLTKWQLKASEVRVLVAIKEDVDPEDGNGITVTALSKRLKVTSPTVTQMINNLIRLGYVSRSAHPSDRRITELSLTAKGDEIAREASEAFTRMFQGFIDFLGKEQSEQLIRLLGQTFVYFQRLSEEER